MLYKSVVKPGERSQLRLSVEVMRYETVAILQCKGRLQFRAEAELFAAKASQVIKQKLHIILDFGELEVMDSAGIGELVLVHMRARAAEREVRIARPNKLVQKLLQLTNVALLFETCANVDQALESLHESVSG